MRLVLVLSLLVAGAAHAAVDENSAGLVTDLVTAALAKEPAFEVVSSADVRRQLELEAEKQASGCDANDACLAEIAGAMGAKLVVYGKLGSLDDVVVLTLNLFDSSQGRAAGRVVVREPSLKAISDKVDGAVHELVAPFVKDAGGARTKLLVLDVEAPKRLDGAGPVVVDDEAPGDPLFTGGLVGVVGGAVTGVVGAGLYGVAVLIDGDADNPDHDAVRANELYDQRDVVGKVGLGVGAVGALALVVGAGLLGVAVVTE